MTRRITQQAFWGFGFSILVLCIVNIISFRAVHSLAATEEDRGKTLQLMVALQKVESELMNADRAQRGFLLTSDPTVLAPYNLSLQNNDQNFQTLRDMTRSDKTMAREVSSLETLARAKLADMQEGVEMRDRVGFDAAVQIVLTGKGNKIMGEIRSVLTKLIKQEYAGLQVRDAKVHNETESARLAMLFGTPIALLVTIFAGFMIRSSMREREMAARDLRLAHDGLEHKVLERTRDLKNANSRLQEEVVFRQNTEVALEKQSHFLSATLESLDQGIIACAEDGQIVLVNNRTRELLGLPEGHVSPDLELWRNFYKVYQPDGTSPIEPAAAPLSRALRGDTVRNAELVVELLNGQRSILQATGQQIIDGSGRSLGAVVALRDVTEIKRSERAKAAQQAAEASNRAKSEFLSRMSHELRTPLNAILGFAQLMQLDEHPPEHVESLDQIVKGGRHLLSLINEVLDISRIEAGNLAISLEPVLVKDAVSDAVSLVASIASQKHISIEYSECMQQETYVRADRQRVKQVLLNLLANAVKYNREGGWIKVSCGTTAKQQFRISISDSGPGISPERLHRLFTPFDRLDADKSGVEGTGLGLCLSKGLVELMGGSIGVESVEGNGSTFWFELDVVEGPEETAGCLVASGSDMTNTEVQCIATVLYIEDNISNIRLVEQILRQRPGLSLLAAMDGQTGIDMAQAHNPNVIFLDLNLPDMHGSNVLRLLQEDSKTRSVPVVIVSADASPGQIDKLMTAGAKNYLTKPINVLQFLQELDNLVQPAKPLS